MGEGWDEEEGSGRRCTARDARGLHFKGMGHSGPARGVLTGCAAEGMEVGAEHKIVPLAQRNAQATQGSSDPAPLSDTATVRGEVPQLVEQRVGIFVLSLRGRRHNDRTAPTRKQNNKLTAPRTGHCSFVAHLMLAAAHQ